MNIYQKREVSEFIKKYLGSPKMKAEIQRQGKEMLKREVQRRLIRLMKILDAIKEDEGIPR
jgi:truncated hemoglobin YjbI